MMQASSVDAMPTVVRPGTAGLVRYWLSTFGAGLAAILTAMLIVMIPTASAHTGSSGGHGGGYGGGRSYSAHGAGGGGGGWSGYHGGWHGGYHGGWGGFGYYPYFALGWDEGFYDPYWGSYALDVMPPDAAAAYAAPPAPAPAPSYWYYCADANAYYPYVQQCASPWQRIPTVPH